MEFRPVPWIKFTAPPSTAMPVTLTPAPSSPDKAPTPVARPADDVPERLTVMFGFTRRTSRRALPFPATLANRLTVLYCESSVRARLMYRLEMLYPSSLLPSKVAV